MARRVNLLHGGKRRKVRRELKESSIPPLHTHTHTHTRAYSPVWKKAIKREFPRNYWWRAGCEGRRGRGRTRTQKNRLETAVPRGFRRGEMARLSHRTDIRAVHQQRTKSYIHAGSHYASLSRLGSDERSSGKRGLEREGRGWRERVVGERKALRDNRGEKGGGATWGPFRPSSSFFSSRRGGEASGAYTMVTDGYGG